MKYISILGSTGSIGTQALDVVRNSNKKIKILGLAANKNIKLLIKQIDEFKPQIVCVYDKEAFNNLKEIISKSNSAPKLVTGMDGLVEVASYKGNELLLTSVVGMIGLIPTIEAIHGHIDIALANKETLVTAGDIVIKEAKKYGVKILPVDSEHSAIFQCLKGENRKNIKNIILTASGGPFRKLSKEEIKYKKASEALKHPNWNMGAKISIDSATMMNKGLEIIEAYYLFGVKKDQIKVLIHPQSIVHSIVEFKDGSVKAQLADTDMRGPISYSLFYPDRKKQYIKDLDLTETPLSFSKINEDNFPCFSIAKKALIKGGSALTVLNAANETAVYAYLKDKIGFYDINRLVENAINSHSYLQNPSLDDIIRIDRAARSFTEDMIEKISV